MPAEWNGRSVERLLAIDLCPCGSGFRFYRCCMPRAQRIVRKMRASARKERAEAPFRGPESIRADYRGYRVRVLENTVLFRPQSETFHEFLVFILKQTLGKEWYECEVRKPLEERHIAVRWIFAWHDLAKKYAPENHQSGQVFEGPASGEAMAVMSLADDIYRLRLIRELPADLVKRLRSWDGFQGARYEIGIAATFVRGGFTMKWLFEKSRKHNEFEARHKHTGETMVVEAKSRHRSGILHQVGDVPVL